MALGDIPAELRPHVALIKHLINSFARHIGGRPHGACDRLHLQEIIERLQELSLRVTSLPLADAVRMRLDMLRTLAREIETFEKPSPAEYAAHLAARANQQFTLFKRLVVGRTLVRPALVARIAANLETVERELEAIPSASIPNPDYHATNLKLVKRELAKVVEVRDNPERELPAAERARLLATAAMAEREDYRTSFAGRDRATVDLDRLGQICDRLGEIAFQVVALPPEVAGELTQQLAENLDAYEVEFNLCADHRKRFITLSHVVRSADSLRAQLLAADAPEAVRKQAVASLDALLADTLVREVTGTPSN
ncbi:MAG: hypothetical protein AB7T06_15695 [Kofleriaceae bacterium]